MGVMIRQKEENDCGVACLAMLGDISYEEARELLWPDSKKIDYTEITQISSCLIVLGHCAVEECKCTNWEDIPNNSLVYIENSYGSYLSGHFVVYRKKKIYDPARGVFKPSKYDKQPNSYVQIEGRGD